MKNKTFKELFEAARKKDRYWVAEAIHDFTEDICRLMEEKKINKADLARIMKVSPAYITKILRGNANFTIDTMVRLARALGASLQLRVASENKTVEWMEKFRVPMPNFPQHPFL